MRITRSALIGTAVAIALFGRNEALYAEDQAPAASTPATPAEPVEEVVVTGIRYSIQQSLEQKRAAVTSVDVITAEDIGKMPDKNVADALERVPGVNISAAGANEGGFDEADRVSMKGTNPSYTQTTIDGHFVASGDWFVLDQTGTVGRSVSYTLLPSEIVNRVDVWKSQQADLIEGGIAGTVDIVTRKPLEFQKPSLEVSAGAVYADLPDKTDPQFSALGSWVNEGHNFGVLLQGFYEQRDLRRDGQEILSYGQIAPGSAIAVKDPGLTNVYYPGLIDSALFTQTRTREGGLVNVEFQPNDSLTIDASGFYSKLNASDYNRSYSFWGNNVINSGAGVAPNPGYVVQNNTLTAATFPGVAGTYYAVYDQISRPDEGSNSNFGNLDVTWRASDRLTFKGQFGVGTGHGYTPAQDVSETLAGDGSGASYILNRIATAASWNLGNTNVTSPSPNGVPVAFSWIFGDQNLDVLDKELWAKIDGDFKVDSGPFKDLEFGVRYSDHWRHLWNVIGQGPSGPAAETPATYPVGYSNFPSNFGAGLGSGFPTGIWYWTPAQLAAYDAADATRDPISRADWTSDYGLEEKDTALYAQGNFKGNKWSGNIGLRAVRSSESVVSNIPASATDPNAITTSAFGPYVQQTANNTYYDFLPSANLKLDVTPDLVGRVGVSQSMARPDYSALAGSVSFEEAPINPSGVGTGTGGNPDLRPILSDNVDAGLEWYFEPRAILAADIFYMSLHDYVGLSAVERQFETFNLQYPNGFLGNYDITEPYNATGRVEGAVLDYQQTFFKNWGVEFNYTYADGKQTSGVPLGGTNALVGTSKDTLNAIAFYENQWFSVRVAYNYRSEFYSGLDRSTAFSQAGIGTLSASVVYNVTSYLSVNLDGLNLNNPTLKYYALSEDQPRAFYKNGSQYYLTARLKL